MGELKPIGSEKLSADAKMKRILELTYYQSENDLKKSSTVVKESKTGVYGIVKEKDGYYVKKGLNENSLDYIGGLFMKNKNKFSSYGEALKKMEFLTEQEELQEATKYVLKSPKPAPKPQEEAPAPMPTGEAPPEAATPDPTAMDTPGADTPTAPGDELGGEAPENPDDYLKVIQKMTGRLTQKLNTFQDKLESKDIKYVLNMVLAAVDLDKLEEADEEEILAKFENDEENPEGTPESGFPGDETTTPPAEDEIGETNASDGMDTLEQLINSPFEDDNTGANEYEFEDDDEIPLPVEEPDFEGEDEDEKVTDDEDVVDFSKFDDTDSVEPEMEPKKDDEERLSKGNNGFSMNEEDPTVNDEVKELDIDELTNMVNNSVKDSLSKYFS